jgi:hypothetical protein
MTTNEPPPYPGEPNPSGSDLPSYGSTPPPPEGSYPPPPPQGSYPPPPPGGYQPPIGGGDAYSPTDAIGYGWRKFTQNVGPLILGALIVVVAAIVLAIVAEKIAPSPTYFDSDGFHLPVGDTVASLIAQTIAGTIGYIFTAMLARGALDVVEGQSFDIGRAFGKLDIGTVLITGLMVSALTLVGYILCYLPGIVFSIFAFFTIYFVVDKAQQPVEALKSSFSLVGGNFGNAFLTGLLAGLVLIVGVIALCVGILAAIPVVTIAAAYAYKRFLGEPVAA